MKKFLAILICFLWVQYCFGFVGVQLPHAALEYNISEATTLHGTPITYSKSSPTTLHDIEMPNTTYWANKTAITLSTINAYGHYGLLGDDQATANGRVDKLQLWGWLDKNGNTVVDSADSRGRRGTTQWLLLYEIDPDGDDPAIADGDVVGYNTIGTTADWHSNILKNGSTITFNAGEVWIIIIRVVETSGNTNLFDTYGGTEQWDNGDTSDGIGSDVATDKYIDINGNSPNTSDARLSDDDIIVYYPNIAE